MGATLVPLPMKPIPSPSCMRLNTLSKIIVSIVSIPDIKFKCDRFLHIIRILCLS